MKIGIISDTHDNIENLAKIREKLAPQIDELIHCGDFCAPFMIEELDEFNKPVHAIFGNTDDRLMTPQKAKDSANVHFHGDYTDIEIGGKQIFIVHFPELALHAAKSGDYDLVCFGHTHLAQKEFFERDGKKTLMINPGEIMGRNGKITYAIYDTEKHEVEFYSL